MSDMEKRKFFYPKVRIDGNEELDWLDTKFTEFDGASSQLFTISSVFEYRPDLISLKFYGSFHYGWLIAMHNDFLDPVYDFKKGIVIDIPSIDSYFDFYRNNTKAHSRRELFNGRE